MSAARNLCLIVALLLTPFLASPAAAAAQPSGGYPFGYAHDIPYFAMDLLPGDIVEVGIWVEFLARQPLTTVQYTGQFGSIPVQTVLTATGPSINRAVDTLTAEQIMAECTDGFIQVDERILQQDAAGNFTILVHKRENLAPCSWAGSDVTPLPPVQLETCGPDNDSIQIGRQVPGLSWDEGVWKGNTRTVTFRADTGYTLVGQDTFTFTDSGGCTVGPAEAPVQTWVCGPDNDRFTMPSQPPAVILGFDSGWVDGQRTFHFVADTGYTLDGPGEFVYTDQANRLCPQPWPTPPPVVITPRATFPPIVIRPTPRGFPVPVITIVPTTDPSITQPPEWTPTPRVWNPIPLNPTPRGFPLPTFMPFSPKAKPTPMVDAGVPTQAALQTRVGEVAVLALAPIAVIIGAIAANNRRHDD